MREKNLKTAYSLVELSIVIVIISILITGAMSVSVSSINNAKIKTTNDRLVEVYKAIGNYLLINKRLPCPASITKVKTVDSDYGTEMPSGCSGTGVYSDGGNLFFGMIPIRALGLANEMAEDGFETKIAYVVDKRFTVAPEAVPNFTTTPTSHITFSTATKNNVITINNKFGSVVQTITNDAILVLISYGANKSGGFNANSSSINTRSSDTEELAISINNSNIVGNTFYASSGASDVFDDILLFKTRDNIVSDFNAITLIPCQNAQSGSSANSSLYSSSSNAKYGEVVYSSACPNDITKKGYVKCEGYGTWTEFACP